MQSLQRWKGCGLEEGVHPIAVDCPFLNYLKILKYFLFWLNDTDIKKTTFCQVLETSIIFLMICCFESLHFSQLLYKLF